MIDGLDPVTTAFLGGAPNQFTRVVPGIHEFFDKYAGGVCHRWDINSDWSLPATYDLIICTRCPYFSSSHDFVDRCMRYLNPGGHLLLDWGLGDHWRFPNYKVGWIRDEHEWAYDPENLLHSCLWRSEFVVDPTVMDFWDHVRGRFGYPRDASLDAVVRAEVPVIIDYEFDKLRFKFLWPEAPQLYIMTLSTKRDV